MRDRIVTCECGLVWKLRKVKVIMRDADSLNCNCGRELISWNGGHIWTGEIIPQEKSK